MTKNEFFTIADKYKLGLCSHAEKKIIESFCQEVQLTEISTKWSLSEEQEIQIRMMSRISKSINQIEISEDQEKHNTGRSIGVVWKIAAVIALLVVTSFTFYFLTQEKGGVRQVHLSVQQMVKNNPNGVKSHIMLPDGTNVWMNAASKISYAKGFSDTSRVITLSGEAYFEVVKDKKRPFRVISGPITTTALGTSFNINSYKKENIRVSLVTGKVDVVKKGTKAHVTLTPGNQAVADKSGLSVNAFFQDSTLAWKDGKIYFNDTYFEDMINVLEKWYDVKFVVKNVSEADKSMKAIGQFNNEPLENVLKVLSHSMDFEFEINEKIVTIKFPDKP